MTGTRVAVLRGADGPTRVELVGGLLGCRRLPDEDGVVRVALVATQALLLAGDDVRVGVEVGDGLALEVVEVTGTVAYDMQGGSARWRVDVRVGSGALLVWDALPFVVATGADVRRSTTVDLAEGATAVLRETLVLGRTGESGGRLVTTTDVRLDARPLLVETLTVDPTARADPALLGGARCLDTVAVLGARHEGPVPEGAVALELDGPGTLLRASGDDAHTTDLGTAVTHLPRLRAERDDAAERGTDEDVPDESSRRRPVPGPSHA